MLTIRSRQASTNRSIEQPHETGEADEPDAVAAQQGVGRGGKGRAVTLGHDFRRDAGRRRPFETRCIGPVADHDPDLGGIARIGAGLDQGLQIRPATGDQYRHPERRRTRRIGAGGPTVDGVLAKTAL